MRWEFVAACAFRRVPWRDGVLDCRGAVGVGGCVSGSGMSFLGLHIIYMMNVTS